MDVRKEFIGGIAVFYISGKITNYEESTLCHESVKEITENNTKKIIIDLSEIIWLNSQGVGMIISCFSTIRTAVGDFKISGGNEKVIHVLTLTKVLDIIPHYPDLDAAIQSFDEE